MKTEIIFKNKELLQNFQNKQKDKKLSDLLSENIKLKEHIKKYSYHLQCTYLCDYYSRNFNNSFIPMRKCGDFICTGIDISKSYNTYLNHYYYSKTGIEHFMRDYHIFINHVNQYHSGILSNSPIYIVVFFISRKEDKIEVIKSLNNLLHNNNLKVIIDVYYEDEEPCTKFNN